ncbi:MAG: DsbA family oxidoreductase [Promethearchaeota archaeon]|jgi:predicted DsbA family dithiol-disulfide isomerase
MDQKKIKVVVFSDYICPFCYIGFKRIEKLEEQFDLDVEWRPFELHPEIPKNGASVSKLQFPKGYLEMALANVNRLAKEDGIELKFSDKFPNSQLALIFSEFAKKAGKFDEFHKMVFEAYWKEGKDIGDPNLLLNLAESIGLNIEELQEYSKSDEPLKILKQSNYELGRCGINGVPTFFIEDRLIYGAQPYEMFEMAINSILEEDP